MMLPLQGYVSELVRLAGKLIRFPSFPTMLMTLFVTVEGELFVPNSD